MNEKNMESSDTPNDEPGGNGKENNWKKNPKIYIPFLAALVIGTIVDISLTINIFSDYNIFKTGIYWLAIGSICLLIAIRWHQEKKDVEVLAKFLKVNFVPISVVLLLITGITGYNWYHFTSFKNERLIKNDIIKTEREKAQGIEVELITGITIDHKFYAMGTKFPAVLVDNSTLLEQNGPYKSISVYLPNGREGTIRLDYVNVNHKTVRSKGYDFIPGEKVQKITFKTSDRVVIWKSWQKDKTIIISGFGDDTVYFRDGSRMAKVPSSGVVTSGINQPLEMQYKPGGTLYLNM